MCFVFEKKKKEKNWNLYEIKNIYEIVTIKKKGRETCKGQKNETRWWKISPKESIFFKMIKKRKTIFIILRH